MMQPSGWIQVMLGAGIALIALGVGAWFTYGIKTRSGWIAAISGFVACGFTLASHFELWGNIGRRHSLAIIISTGVVIGLIGAGLAFCLIFFNPAASPESVGNLKREFQHLMDTGERIRDEFW